MTSANIELVRAATRAFNDRDLRAAALATGREVSA